MTAYAKLHPKHLRALVKMAEGYLDDLPFGTGSPDAREAVQAANRELAHVDRVKVKRAPARKAKREKKTAKHLKTQQVRDVVFARARVPGTMLAQCEVCRDVPATELHHLFGGAYRQSHEAVETCVAICSDCHDDLTENTGGAVSAWALVVEHLERINANPEWREAATARLMKHHTRATLDAMRKAGAA